LLFFFSCLLLAFFIAKEKKSTSFPCMHILRRAIPCPSPACPLVDSVEKVEQHFINLGESGHHGDLGEGNTSEEQLRLHGLQARSCVKHAVTCRFVSFRHHAMPPSLPRWFCRLASLCMGFSFLELDSAFFVSRCDGVMSSRLCPFVV